MKALRPFWFFRHPPVTTDEKLPAPFNRKQRAGLFRLEDLVVQLGLALAMYASDFDERLPNGAANFLGQGWAGQIFPFVKLNLRGNRFQRRGQFFA